MYFRLPVEPWIALIKRGTCKFEDKVKHVYNYNAIGVIVYNDRDSQNLDKMQIVDKDRESLLSLTLSFPRIVGSTLLAYPPDASTTAKSYYQI